MGAIIVHGPRSCGKTVHREQIAAKFAIPANRIVDTEFEQLPPKLAPDTLYLISTNPGPFFRGVQTISYFDLGLPDLRRHEPVLRGGPHGQPKITERGERGIAEMDERQKRLDRFRRAGDRAKKVLKVGDRLQVEYGCSERLINVTMTGWEVGWICCRTYNDISPRWVRKVNGQPVNFDDPEGEEGQ